MLYAYVYNITVGFVHCYRNIAFAIVNVTDTTVAHLSNQCLSLNQSIFLSLPQDLLLYAFHTRLKIDMFSVVVVD